MAKIVLNMDYIDNDNELASNIVATYYNLDYPGVVKIQGAVVGAMQSLGEQRAQEKAAAATASS